MFGHTPSRQNDLKHAHGLKLINVDAGICRVYGGHRVYLEITPDGQAVQHSKGNSGWQKKVLGTPGRNTSL